MTTDRRVLEDWEKAECAALKQALARYNASAPKDCRFTQERLAGELGMAQGNLNGHLNGRRPLNMEMAAKIFVLTGIPVDEYSPRLAADIKSLAASVPSVGFPPFKEQQTSIDSATAEDLQVLHSLYALKGRVTPRSKKALDSIERAALDGRLTEDDLVLLERIAKRFEDTAEDNTSRTRS